MNPSPSASPVPRWPVLAGAAVIVAAVWVIYANSLSVPFLFDDGPAIVRNQTIRSLWPLGGALRPPLSGAGVTGRPLVNLSLAINYALGGLDVRGYHTMNIGLHALAALTLFGVLRRTLRGRPGLTEDASAVAWIIALMWAVHPLLTESVVCVVQRSEMIGGLFYLLTLYCFIRSSEPGAAKRRWQAAAVTTCFLGMASKEIVATAPLMVLLYDRTFVAGTFANAWRQRKHFYGALAATWLLLVWLVIGSDQRAGIVGFGLGMSSWDYLVTQGLALTTYLKLAVWPHPLIVDYGTEVSRMADVWWRGLLVLTLLGGTAWALWRRPVWGFLGAWFFVILAPSSSFLPLTTQPIAEHRMYLPLIAVLAAAGAVLHRFAGRGSFAAGALLAVVLGCATNQRNQDYRSELTLWTDLVARQPQNARAHASLAGALSKLGRWPEAIDHYEAALRIRPDYADAHSDYANALTHAGRRSEAIRQYGIALQLKPADADIGYNLGAALAAGREWALAIAAYEDVLRTNPQHQLALTNLGDALLQNGRPAEALSRFECAAALAPDSATSHQNVAAALTALGRWPEAAAQYKAALERAPGDATLQVGCADALAHTGDIKAAAIHYEAAVQLRPDLPELHYNLGNFRLQLDQPTAAAQAFEAALRLRSVWPEARHNLALALVRLGRVEDALRQYQEVLRLLPRSALVHHNMALALALAGRTAEAIQHEETALEIEPDYREAADQLRRLSRH